MSLALRLVAMFGLGLYTSLGFHFYFILMSRAKSDVVRLRLVFLSIVLVIILPIIAWGNLFSGVGMFWSRIHREVIGWGGILLWIGPVGVYIAMNWRVFNQPVNAGGNTNGSLSTTSQKFYLAASKRKRKRVGVLLTAMSVISVGYLWDQHQRAPTDERGQRLHNILLYCSILFILFIVLFFTLRRADREYELSQKNDGPKNS